MAGRQHLQQNYIGFPGFSRVTCLFNVCVCLLCYRVVWYLVSKTSQEPQSPDSIFQNRHLQNTCVPEARWKKTCVPEGSGRVPEGWPEAIIKATIKQKHFLRSSYIVTACPSPSTRRSVSFRPRPFQGMVGAPQIATIQGVDCCSLGGPAPDCNGPAGGLLQPGRAAPPDCSGPGADCCSPEALPEFCGIQAQSLNGVIDCWKQFVVKPGLCVTLSGLPGGIKIKRCPLGFLCKWTDSWQFERAGLEITRLRLRIHQNLASPLPQFSSASSEKL